MAISSKLCRRQCWGNNYGIILIVAFLKQIPEDTSNVNHSIIKRQFLQTTTIAFNSWNLCLKELRQSIKFEWEWLNENYYYFLFFLKRNSTVFLLHMNILFFSNIFPLRDLERNHSINLHNLNKFVFRKILWIHNFYGLEYSDDCLIFIVILRTFRSTCLSSFLRCFYVEYGRQQRTSNWILYSIYGGRVFYVNSFNHELVLVLVIVSNSCYSYL